MACVMSQPRAQAFAPRPRASRSRYAQTGIKAVLDDQEVLKNPFTLLLQVPDPERPGERHAWEKADKFNWFAYSFGQLKAKDLSSVVIWGTCVKKAEFTRIERGDSNNENKALHKNNLNTSARRNARRQLDQIMQSAGFGGKGYLDLQYDFEVVGACRFPNLGQLNAALNYKQKYGMFMTASSVMKDRVTSRVMSRAAALHNQRVAAVTAPSMQRLKSVDLATKAEKKNPTPNLHGVSDDVIKGDLCRVLHKKELGPYELKELFPVVRNKFAQVAESFTDFIAKTPLALLGHELRNGNSKILDTLNVSVCDARCTTQMKLMEDNPIVDEDFTVRVHKGRMSGDDALKLQTALMNTHRYNSTARKLVTDYPDSDGCEFITWPGTSMEAIRSRYKAQADAIFGRYLAATRKSGPAMWDAFKQHRFLTTIREMHAAKGIAKK